MTVYEYRPPSSGRGERISLLLAILLSCAVMLWGVKAGIEALKIAATVIALFAVLACTRIILTSYVYALERTDSGTVDLVIYEIRRKRSVAVCRVAVEGGRVVRRAKGFRKPAGKTCNYCPGLFGRGCVRFLPTEADGGGTVMFSPDTEMLALMKMFGAGDDSPEL